MTTHAAQGATVDQSFVLGSDELYREWGYTALSRHRDQARFYVVSPGSVERALPGLEPYHDALHEDVAAMLSPSRQQELALDLLDRAGTGAAQRAVRQAREEIERAQRRIAAMREERANLGLLQRFRRAAVDEDIARQQEAVERWTAQAAAVSEPEGLARHEAPPIVADPHEARLMLVAAMTPSASGRRASRRARPGLAKPRSSSVPAPRRWIQSPHTSAPTTLGMDL